MSTTTVQGTPGLPMMGMKEEEAVIPRLMLTITLEF